MAQRCIERLPWLAGRVGLMATMTLACNAPQEDGKGPAGLEGPAASASTSSPVASVASSPGSGSAPAQTKIVEKGTFSGFCEASAIVPWEGGYLVADNETEDNLYAFDKAMKPGSYTFKPEYQVRDVEALVVKEQKIALIGSHSTNSAGEVKKKRQLVQLAGSPPRALNLDGCAACKAAMGIAPKEGGLSIEGATFWDSKLWLGVRSPLVDKKAMLLLMDGEISESAAINVDKVMQIDLGGLGVRDLVVRDGELFVLAGPLVDSTDPHALYRLAKPEAAARRVVGDLPPSSEGISPTAEVDEWLVVTDGAGDPKSNCERPAEWFRVHIQI